MDPATLAVVGGTVVVLGLAAGVPAYLASRLVRRACAAELATLELRLARAESLVLDLEHDAAVSDEITRAYTARLRKVDAVSALGGDPLELAERLLVAERERRLRRPAPLGDPAAAGRDGGAPREGEGVAAPVA